MDSLNKISSSGQKQFKAIGNGNQTATQQQLEYMYNTTAVAAMIHNWNLK